VRFGEGLSGAVAVGGVSRREILAAADMRDCVRDVGMLYFTKFTLIICLLANARTFTTLLRDVSHWTTDAR
jgi:hypothetical protein